MSGKQIAVIGAGLAGMSSAYRRKKLGFEPTVFERNDRVGGRIQTLTKGTYRESIAVAMSM